MIRILLFTSVVYSQSILGSWKLQEQYKNNQVVTFKSYMKYEFSAPNVWRSYVGDYVDYGFFSTKEQSIVLKFDDGEAAKGTYSIKGDSLLVLNIEDSKMVFKRLPKKPEL
ncbi:MAG: hypothetical protein QF795_02600 [Candidatus Marinimicrobia bacterium]|nr:hypothetical protein [Candidatus Neomarinimicrobiota bacterium]